jgi:hypothetical protein
MRGTGWFVGALLLGCAAAGAKAQTAADFTAEYLAGTWTTGSKENCTAPEHERTVFRDDGTFASEHHGKAIAVGFFEAQEDRLAMQILASPDSLEPALRDRLGGGHHYLSAQALVFDVTGDSFRMVQSVAGQLQGLNLFRCP